MTFATQCFWDKLAGTTRLLLIAGIAVVGALLVTSPQSLTVQPAHASGIAAAPGLLAMNVNIGGAAKFYIIDSSRQVICVYEIEGERVRLVSARKYDFDAQIFDGSIGVGKFPKGIEGGNGVDRREAKDYSEAITKMKTDFENKAKK